MILALQGRGVLSPGQCLHDRAWDTFSVLKLIFWIKIKHRFGARREGARGWGVRSRYATLSFSWEGAWLAQETDWADLEPQPLGGIPKVIQHHINDGHLVDACSVDLHHGLGVALLQLVCVCVCVCVCKWEQGGGEER